MPMKGDAFAGDCLPHSLIGRVRQRSDFRVTLIPVCRARFTICSASLADVPQASVLMVSVGQVAELMQNFHFLVQGPNMLPPVRPGCQCRDSRCFRFVT
jgi:hypothetical protein